MPIFDTKKTKFLSHFFCSSSFFFFFFVLPPLLDFVGVHFAEKKKKYFCLLVDLYFVVYRKSSLLVSCVD